MMASEITEDVEDGEAPYLINSDSQKERIRKIIRKQRYQYLSSPSSSSLSSAVVSCSSSSLSSSHRNSNLLQLMKVGSTSLRRLFDMEHISLSAHFNYYSGSPVTKPILLWGSDLEEEAYDPWEFITCSEIISGSLYNDIVTNTEINSSHSPTQAGLSVHEMKKERRNMKLERTKSFRRLPKLNRWIWRGFRFRLRFRRLRIMIFGRKF